MQHSVISTSVDLSTTFFPIPSRIRALIWLSLRLGMCPAQTLHTHIALLQLYCAYTWYYTNNATFCYFYFRRPVEQHFPLPSSVCAVIWLSLSLCMCPAPIMDFSSYILRIRGIITIMQSSLTSISVDLSSIISPILSRVTALIWLSLWLGMFRAPTFYSHNARL